MPSSANRARILAALEQEGPMYKSELARKLGLGWGNMEYHVSKLERLGLLKLRSDGSRVWVASVSASDMELLALAKQNPTRQAVLAALYDAPEATAAELEQALRKPRRTVQNHLSELLRVEVVERENEMPMRYRLGTRMRSVLASLLGRP